MAARGRAGGWPQHALLLGGEGCLHAEAPLPDRLCAWVAWLAGWCLQGAGIVWPTRIGKLELNACQVLTKQPFDKARVGLQFGFVPPAV